MEKEKGKKAKSKGYAFEGLEEDDGDKARAEREWVSDEEMPEVEGGAVKELEFVVPESIPLPQATVEEDEML
jgi:hypothetical protein